MKKDLAIIAGLFVLIALILVFGGSYTSLGFLGGGQNVVFKQNEIRSVNVTIKTLAVNAEIAETVDQRRKGLSGRESLPFDTGMLFVFENPGKYGFWMKDMKFAIDIIWLDGNKIVTDVVTNVAPEEGKNDTQLTVYKPANDARYVLEVNAGLVQLNNVQVGDKAFFEF